MTSSFVDTSIFVSFVNKKDQDHKKCVELMERIRLGEFGQPYTSDYVLDEAVTTALIRTRRIDKAVRVGKMILGSKEESIPAIAKLIRVDEAIFSESWNTFKTEKYKELSFTDHTILSQIRDFQMDHLISLDSGFDGLVSRVY